jgi:hypothetical protein
VADIVPAVAGPVVAAGPAAVDTVPVVVDPVEADIALAVVVADPAVVDIVPVVVAAEGPAVVGIVLAVVVAEGPVEVADTVPAAVAAADPVAGSVGEGRATTVAERYAASALTISNTLITRIPTAFAGT